MKFTKTDFIRFLSFLERLEKDRKKKDLTPEIQRPNLFANIREEQNEIQKKGIAKFNLYEVIDGIMDIVVYIINAHGFEQMKDLWENRNKLVQEDLVLNLYHMNNIYNIDNKVLSEYLEEILCQKNSTIPINMVVSLIDSILHEHFFKFTNAQTIDYSIESSAETAVFNILKVLYVIFQVNPLDWLDETIKEVESRTGKWNEKEGKFVKDLGAYSTKEAISIAKEKDTRSYLEKTVFKLTNSEIDSWVFAIKNVDKSKSKNCKRFVIRKYYMANYNLKLIEEYYKKLNGVPKEETFELIGSKTPIKLLVARQGVTNKYNLCSTWCYTSTGFTLTNMRVKPLGEKEEPKYESEEPVNSKEDLIKEDYKKFLENLLRYMYYTSFYKNTQCMPDNTYLYCQFSKMNTFLKLTSLALRGYSLDMPIGTYGHYGDVEINDKLINEINEKLKNISATTKTKNPNGSSHSTLSLTLHYVTSLLPNTIFEIYLDRNIFNIEIKFDK